MQSTPSKKLSNPFQNQTLPLSTSGHTSLTEIHQNIHKVEGRQCSPTTPALGGFDVPPTQKTGSTSFSTHTNTNINTHVHGHTNGEHQFQKKYTHQRPNTQSLRKSICQIILCIILIISTLMFFTGAHYTTMSILSIIHKEGIRGLRTADGFSRVCRKVVEISETEMLNTLLIIAIIYILLQTFCIPGTVFLNALMGALVGVVLALPITLILGTIGASCCYSLSYFIGVSLVESVDAKLMKGKGLSMIRANVQRYKSDLFVYLIFLRLTPILPNWLINMASPVVNVPLMPFAAATFTGIIPQTFLAVRFGSAVRYSLTIGNISTDDTMNNNNNNNNNNGVMDIVTIWDSLLLIVLAMAVLAAHRLRKKFYS